MPNWFPIWAGFGDIIRLYAMTDEICHFVQFCIHSMALAMGMGPNFNLGWQHQLAMLVTLAHLCLRPVKQVTNSYVLAPLDANLHPPKITGLVFTDLSLQFGDAVRKPRLVKAPQLRTQFSLNGLIVGSDVGHVGNRAFGGGE